MPARRSSAVRIAGRRIVIALLKPLDRLLQWLLLPRPRQVFYFSRPDYTDNAYYIYRRLLLTRNDIEHVWMVIDPRSQARIEAEFAELSARSPHRGHTLKIVRTRTLTGYISHLRSRTVFHTHGVFAVSDRAIRRQIVSLWHGMPIKAIGRLNHYFSKRYPTFGTLHLATSAFFQYIIACSFGAKPESVLVCAPPRCDALLASPEAERSAATIREKLSIAARQKLVLWMPTYRTEPIRAGQGFRSFLDELPEGMMAALEEHCARNHCVVVVKLHWIDPLNGVDLPTDTGHIRYLKSAQWTSWERQLYELIAASDALMTDVSSVLIDYLPTGRPIGLCPLDPAAYSRALNFPLSLLHRSARFTLLNEAADIAEFCRRIAEPPQSPAAANDISQILHDSFAEPGSEAILRRVGL